MLAKKGLILGLAVPLAALVIAACSNSGQTSSGVARIEDSQTSGVGVISAVQADTSESSALGPDALNGDTNAGEPTNEEVVTGFSMCMRDQGIDVPDPALNADGSIDWAPIKQAIGQAGKSEGASNKVLDECLQLLEGVTASQQESPEDDIELQDNLLEFAQCLRDEGIDVPDPDLSGDPRAGMGLLKEGLKEASPRVEKSFAVCNELVFGAGKSAK